MLFMRNGILYHDLISKILNSCLCIGLADQLEDRVNEPHWVKALMCHMQWALGWINTMIMLVENYRC
jgi:hypothetical protein